MTGIQNPGSNDKYWIQYLESGIQSVESRIQDCLGFRYIGRSVISRFPLTMNGISIGRIKSYHDRGFDLVSRKTCETQRYTVKTFVSMSPALRPELLVINLFHNGGLFIYHLICR